jgi:excinuclease ABC subunit B
VSEGIVGAARQPDAKTQARKAQGKILKLGIADLPKEIAQLRKQMLKAAADLDFERAADLRDRVHELEDLELKSGGNSTPFTDEECS